MTLTGLEHCWDSIQHGRISLHASHDVHHCECRLALAVVLYSLLKLFCELLGSLHCGHCLLGRVANVA